MFLFDLNRVDAENRQSGDVISYVTFVRQNGVKLKLAAICESHIFEWTMLKHAFNNGWLRSKIRQTYSKLKKLNKGELSMIPYYRFELSNIMSLNSNDDKFSFDPDGLLSISYSRKISRDLHVKWCRH